MHRDVIEKVLLYDVYVKKMKFVEKEEMTSDMIETMFSLDRHLFSIFQEGIYYSKDIANAHYGMEILTMSEKEKEACQDNYYFLRKIRCQDIFSDFVKLVEGFVFIDIFDYEQLLEDFKLGTLNYKANWGHRFRWKNIFPMKVKLKEKLIQFPMYSNTKIYLDKRKTSDEPDLSSGFPRKRRKLSNSTIDPKTLPRSIKSSHHH